MCHEGWWSLSLSPTQGWCKGQSPREVPHGPPWSRWPGWSWLCDGWVRCLCTQGRDAAGQLVAAVERGSRTSPGHGPELHFSVPRATEAWPQSQSSLRGHVHSAASALPALCPPLAQGREVQSFGPAVWCFFKNYFPFLIFLPMQYWVIQVFSQHLHPVSRAPVSIDAWGASGAADPHCFWWRRWLGHLSPSRSTAEPDCCHQPLAKAHFGLCLHAKSQPWLALSR